MKKIYTIFVCICLLAGFVACEKDKDFVLTTLMVQNETITPSYGSATIDCSFKADATISEAFVQYSLSSSFAKYDVAKMTEEKGKYATQLMDLQDNTTYYIRYAVSNKYSSVVSEDVIEFQTLQCTVPTIVLDSIADVWDNRAKAHIHLTFDGGASVTDMGICWSKQANPTIEDIHKSTKDTVTVLDMTDLQENTQYYVRAYAVNKVGVSYSEEVSFTTKEQPSTPIDGTENGYAYVDLGLSVKWATCNVGANKPEDYGDYFAWGETTTRDTYSWSTYKYCNGSDDSLTKYNTSSSYGTVDNKTQLELSDDAAHVNWGGSWRMPTDDELTELWEQCTWTWTTQNGVNGYKVTSKTNSSSIFLPATGYRYNSSLNFAGSYGYYWSSSLYTGSPYRAWSVRFHSSDVYRNDGGYRCSGLSVRPVLGESVVETTIPTVTTTIPTQITETTAVAGGNVTSDGGAEITERGVVYATTQNPTTNNTKVMSGTGTGSFTCNLTGLQPNTTYYVRAYAVNSKGTAYGEEVTFITNKQIVLPSAITAAVTQITETSAVAGGNVTSDGGASVTERGVVYATTQNPTTNNTKVTSGIGTGSFTCNLTDLQPNTKYYVRAYAINEKGTAYGEEVSFTTKEVSISDPTGTENGYGYVDLGLSIKWATMNVGASSPEDYGDYFAWGETEPKDYYDWSTYKYCNGSSSTLTKYNNNSSYGAVDNKTQLELSDDAAYVNWGGAWRMPTDAELTELREQCTWTWASQNGVNGYKVTSKSNGNSIFLPAAGFRYDSSLEVAGGYGFWSSSLYTDYPYNAWYVYFNSGFVSRNGLDRCYGFTVRPVWGEYVMEETVPTVITTTITQITETSAVTGGNVTSDGGASVTERGVVYSTSQNPTTENNKVPNGSGTGEFICNLTGLQANTTYYVRAYAVNSMGTAYGEQVSFTTKEQSSTPIDDTETITVNGVSFKMVAVGGGTFTMGATSEQGSDATSEESPTHSVTLSDFAIGETEVTQELWKAVMGSNPSSFSGTNLPVERVSWNDCQTFISKLNNLTGKNFRLPTEAEWEYAARGGNKSKGYKYAGSNTLGDVAWYFDNSSSKTHPVKQKQANELGLYDMSGNVWEWCQDWYGSYSSSAQTNPTGSTSGSDRVNRGGSWYYTARYCHVSYRNYRTPTITNYSLGLRLAL